MTEHAAGQDVSRSSHTAQDINNENQLGRGAEKDAAFTCPDCGAEWGEPMREGCKRPWHHADEWDWCTEDCPEDCEADHRGEE